MKRFKIGDRVVVLDNFNETALGKVGIIIANRDRGHVVGFFCEGVMSNYELGYFVNEYPDLKATWWVKDYALKKVITKINSNNLQKGIDFIKLRCIMELSAGERREYGIY